MIEFNEEKHTYTVDGMVMPSVTTILSAEGFIDSRWFDDYSRERGTLVHLACHLDDTGELAEESVDPVIVPYLAAYRAFKNESGFVASSSEEPLASETYRFAGTPDKCGTFRDATCAIVDLKTGAVAPWAALQLAGYQILKGSPYRRFALQLMNTGKYKLTAFTDQADRNIFLSAVAVYNWKRLNLKGV